MAGGLIVIAVVGVPADARPVDAARGLRSGADVPGEPDRGRCGRGAQRPVRDDVGNLKLHTLFANAESTLGPLVAAGALRPLLGALSGTVIYVLLESELVPLKVPEGAAGTHFFIALAIVAGFSERWARGVLAGTEERIQTSTAKTNPAPRT